MTKIDEKKKKIFPLDKILTISANEYCENKGKKLTDYELKGIHHMWDYVYKELSETIPDKAVEGFAKVVPSDAEIVVKYTPHGYGDLKENIFHNRLTMGASGTALIPKK